MPASTTDEATKLGRQAMTDIAASILSSPTEGNTGNEPEEETELELNRNAVGQDSEELPEEELEEDDGEETDELDKEDPDDTDEEGESYLDVSDDDMIEVKVDGKVEYHSLGDLKKALSAEGAYQRRLQEATELRKEVDHMKTSTIERANRQAQVLATVFQQAEQQLLQLDSQAPSAALRQSDPTKYFLEKEEYDNRVKDLETRRNDLRKLVSNVDASYTQSLNEYKKDQATQLLKAIPDLTDPTKGKQIMDEITSAASHYGFTEADVASVADHRVYLMARDAARYRALLANKTTVKDTDVTDVTDQKRKTPRKLRSGATSIRNKVHNDSKKAQAARTKAQSGKVSDLAAFIRSPD